ncbi:MAG: hypothetical protein OSA95_05690 [Opitutales bacterium]|nr:hypothetical protein [Opitutales bacterium]
MKKLFILILIPVLINAAPKGVPEGYKLAYKQDFENADSLKDFIPTDSRVWKWGEDGDRGYIEHFGRSKYKYKVRSPYNITLIGGVEVKDFVLFADLQQTGKEYGHRDMCIFYNFQDRSHFYYTHIASVTDNHAHNCFIVNDKPRTKISHETTKGHKWSSKPWHNVKLVREQESGKIDIYVNDMDKPIMRATDKTFGMGRIGFGSFDDTGRISKVRLYAPESNKNPGDDPFTEGR